MFDYSNFDTDLYNSLYTPDSNVSTDEKISSGNTGTTKESNTLDRELPKPLQSIEETYINKFDDNGNLISSEKGSASSESQSESQFSGYKINSENDEKFSAIEKLNAARALMASGKDYQYDLPWDWRFGVAYTNTQSIGNSMPAGPSWVGSPSIMNPFALIRFSHVASLKHHIELLDQKGMQNFRSGGVVQRALKAGDIENPDNEKIQVTTTATSNDVARGVGEGDKKVQINDEETKKKYKISSNDTDLWSDASNGAIYSLQIDETRRIWYIDKTDATWTDFDGNEKQVDSKMEVETQSAYDKSGNLVSNANDDPNKEQFWLTKFNYTKCNITKIGNTNIKAFYGDNTKDSEFSCSKVNEKLNSIAKMDSGSEADKQREYQELISEARIRYNAINKNCINKDAWKSKPYVYKHYILTDKFDKISEQPLEPTIDNLCDPNSWQGKEQFLYNYSDFLYCTYFGWIPNNYLITLRRFPNPVLDNATIFGQSTSGNFVSPIAKAVTWLGEDTGNKLESIANFGWKFNWRELNSSINEVQGNEQGPESTPFGGLGKALGIIQSIAQGGSGFSQISGWDEQRAKFDPYKDGMYANRIYGPVNVIAKTKARERGLEFDNTITINFQYSLKSIGGINPKAAMLDIIANMLALTYSNADFWGGANRYFPNKPSYPFPGGKKGFEQWYSGDFEGFLDSLGKQITSVAGDVMNIIQGLLTNPREALNTLIKGGAKTYMAMKQKDKRPAILTFKATLTGDPVGEWHLTVGNPFNPLLMIGNLIVTGAKIKFSENFGVDDFPHDVSFEVTLEHGRPRDKGDIESMLNRGEGRLHYAPFGVKDEVWNISSATKDSRIDTSWKSKGKSKSSGGNSGDVISNVSRINKGFYEANSKRAFELAQKVGFK